MARPHLPHNTEEAARWYERYISPLALVAGFVADNLFLTRRVDLWQTNALFAFYLVVSGLGIVAINLIESGRVHDVRVVRAAPFIPIIVQFSFGGLFSGYLSLYSRAASLAVSWIIVAVLAALLLGNERFARLYVRVPFQLSVYFGVLFSFLIFFVPVASHAVGPIVFLFSGAISVLLLALFLFALMRIVPERIVPALRATVVSVATIFLALNAAYFLNILPPLPLSLTQAGVYHRVERQDDGTYLLSGEARPWYEAYLRYNTAYHTVGDKPVYVFTSIFAPANFTVGVAHEWQRYDTAAGQWVTTQTIEFQVVGGRDGGYRGYSVAYAVVPGSWRVNVRTHYGQLIGRVAFTVIAASSTPELTDTVE